MGERGGEVGGRGWRVKWEGGSSVADETYGACSCIFPVAEMKPMSMCYVTLP